MNASVYSLDLVGRLRSIYFFHLFLFNSWCQYKYY